VSVLIASVFTRPVRPVAPRVTFAEAAEAHLDDVFAYLVYLTGNRGVAEELAAATFERALVRWERFDPRRGSAKTWLCQLARTVTLDHFRAEARRVRRETAYAATEGHEEEEPAVAALSPALERAVRGLSAADREVIALRVLLELDAAETARLLGISTTACTTRLNRALARLERKVEDELAA
jgi:RNA polymerase sigma-70 factor (ECF subfamily)